MDHLSLTRTRRPITTGRKVITKSKELARGRVESTSRSPYVALASVHKNNKQAELSECTAVARFPEVSRVEWPAVQQLLPEKLVAGVSDIRTASATYRLCTDNTGVITPIKSEPTSTFNAPYADCPRTAGVCVLCVADVRCSTDCSILA